ncbi:MAG: hypothetical protein ACYCQI_00780 [Gammaproteobacteria bacterium]
MKAYQRLFNEKKIEVAPKPMEPINLYEAMLFLLYQAMLKIGPSDKVDSIFKNMRGLIRDYHINDTVRKGSAYPEQCYETLEILRTMAKDEVEELKEIRPHYLIKCMNESGCVSFLKVLADLEIKSVDDVTQYDLLADRLDLDLLKKVNMSKILRSISNGEELLYTDDSLKVNVGSDIKQSL